MLGCRAGSGTAWQDGLEGALSTFCEGALETGFDESKTGL